MTVSLDFGGVNSDEFEWVKDRRHSCCCKWWIITFNMHIIAASSSITQTCLPHHLSHNYFISFLITVRNIARSRLHNQSASNLVTPKIIESLVSSYASTSVQQICCGSEHGTRQRFTLLAPHRGHRFPSCTTPINGQHITKCRCWVRSVCGYCAIGAPNTAKQLSFNPHASYYL